MTLIADIVSREILDSRGNPTVEVEVGLLDEILLTLPRGKSKGLVTTVALQPQLVAPLAVGDPVGTVTLSIEGQTVFESPVVALVAVEPGGFFSRLWDSILMWVAGLFAT